MKSEYTTFDTATDGGFKPTPPGIYPAHVSSFDSNPWNESVVFNLIFKLADDVKEVQVPTGEQNGDGNFHVNKDDDGKTIEELEKAENIDQMLIRFLTVKVKKHDLDKTYFEKKDT